MRTISRVANGTGMPPGQFLLSAEDRWTLVDYVKCRSDRFELDGGGIATDGARLLEARLRLAAGGGAA